jgi:hypothetical protein
MCERHAAHSLMREEEDHERTSARNVFDASRLVLQKVEMMYGVQGDVMGFLCILNFLLPGCCGLPPH